MCPCEASRRLSPIPDQVFTYLVCLVIWCVFNCNIGNLLPVTSKNTLEQTIAGACWGPANALRLPWQTTPVDDSLARRSTTARSWLPRTSWGPGSCALWWWGCHVSGSLCWLLSFVASGVHYVVDGFFTLCCCCLSRQPRTSWRPGFCALCRDCVCGVFVIFVKYVVQG